MLDELPRLEFIYHQAAAHVRHKMPHFEASSLKMAAPDLYVPADRRVGDLLTLEKISDTTTLLRQSTPTESWQETTFGPVRIKLRRTEAPNLGSLAPGDVLDTVSRHDPICKRIGLWTRGNRVFSLEDNESIGRLIELCHTDVMQSQFTVKRTLGHARTVGVDRRIARQLFDLLLMNCKSTHYGRRPRASMSEAQVLHQIVSAADAYDDWTRLELFAGDSSEAGLHIACMVEPFLGYILEGRKSIESRFSKPLIAPYQRVAVGDVVLLKAGPIVASFRTASVEFIELNDSEFNRLVTDYSAAICADEEFWKARAGKRYATLLGISDVWQLTPLKIDKRDRRGWMVLRDNGTGSAADPLLFL